MINIDKLKDLNVLYVEDEERLRESVIFNLKSVVGKIFSANNGKEGLEVFSKEPIDIIISDINMPEMDGLTMIENIRRENELIPIIITTAFSDIEFLQKSIDLQVDKYITKPIDIRQIIKVLIKTSEIIFNRRELIEKDLIIRNNEKIEAMSDLMRNVSHHWRQPLAVISMSAVNIITEKELGTLSDEFLIESCNEIINTSKQLSKTIDDFQNYFEGDEAEEVIELKTTMEEFLKNNYYFLKDKKIEIINDLQPVKILGIKTLFLQIISTILNNAIDALENTNIERKLIFIELTKDTDKIILEIKDNGGGIADDKISHIFNPYVTTKHKSEGTGLSLFVIYKSITEWFKGNITAKNVNFEYEGEKHTGALFRIVFPIV